MVAEKFDQLLKRYKDRVAGVTARFVPTGDLKKVYVQYQFDAAGGRGAVRGMKIGRYSEKYGHLEGTVEVTRDSFENTDDGSRTAILANLLIEALEQMQKKVEGKIESNLGDLVAQISADARSLQTQ